MHLLKHKLYGWWCWLCLAVSRTHFLGFIFKGYQRPSCKISSRKNCGNQGAFSCTEEHIKTLYKLGASNEPRPDRSQWQQLQRQLAEKNCYLTRPDTAGRHGQYCGPTQQPLCQPVRKIFRKADNGKSFRRARRSKRILSKIELSWEACCMSGSGTPSAVIASKLKSRHKICTERIWKIFSSEQKFFKGTVIRLNEKLCSILNGWRWLGMPMTWAIGAPFQPAQA